jgi:hypothetical protein
MTFDEYIAKRDEFRLRLEIVMASAIPSRVKTARIRAITREVIDLKREVSATIAELRP